MVDWYSEILEAVTEINENSGAIGMVNQCTGSHCKRNKKIFITGEVFSLDNYLLMVDDPSWDCFYYAPN